MKRVETVAAPLGQCGLCPKEAEASRAPEEAQDVGMSQSRAVPTRTVLFALKPSGLGNPEKVAVLSETMP